MKKMILALLALLLTACTMTSSEYQNGDCLETGFEVVCTSG